MSASLINSFVRRILISEFDSVGSFYADVVIHRVMQSVIMEDRYTDSVDYLNWSDFPPHVENNYMAIRTYVAKAVKTCLNSRTGPKKFRQYRAIPINKSTYVYKHYSIWTTEDIDAMDRLLALQEAAISAKRDDLRTIRTIMKTQTKKTNTPVFAGTVVSDLGWIPKRI